MVWNSAVWKRGQKTLASGTAINSLRRIRALTAVPLPPSLTEDGPSSGTPDPIAGFRARICPVQTQLLSHIRACHAS